jgi:Mg2+ and Co2+ transporter CorA
MKQVQELSNLKEASSDPFVLIFIGLEDEMIWEIRKMFKLHPLLDSECESSYFNNKDSVLIFEDYLFVTINDIDFKQDDPESPLSLKLVKHKNFILIFSEDDLYCIEKVFNTNKSETLDQKFYSVSVSDSVNEQKQLAIPEVWLDISETCGCTSTEVMLHRVLEAFYCRFETFILSIDQIAKKYMDKCREVAPNDRVEFITKLSDNQKKLIYMFDLINPKIGVFQKLIASKIISDAMKMYLKCFLSKTYILQQRLRMSKSMLNSAEQIYSAQVDQALYDYSDKLNQISKYFSAISAIFLPLNLITAYFGMNVMVPGQDYDNYNTFLIVCGICVMIFLMLFVYYKMKKWI